MGNSKDTKKSPGCLGFIVGGMSFIPLVGVLFGIIAIIWGSVVKSTKLVVVGVCGVLFTFILYGFLGYFGFVEEGGTYDELRSELAKVQLDSLVQAIEVYKVQNGAYPRNLSLLNESLPEGSLVSIIDPTQVSKPEGNYFHYDLIDENRYHVRALGRDGILDTVDDVFPTAVDNIGLVARP